VTETHAGHETPEAATASGVFHAIFQSENKKMHLSFFALRGGSELKNEIFQGGTLSKM
jgi:hypothetical protein